MSDSKAGLKPGGLKQGVTLIDLVMLGAGTAIGAAIFSVLGPATQVGGAGILVAAGLAALPMVLFALVYAYMASAVPRTAASYEWQRQFSHPVIAFSIVWLRVLSNAVVMIVLGRVLMNYLGMVLPLPAVPVILGLFTLIFALNYLGVAVAARAQTVLMIMLLGLFAVLVVSGAPAMKPELFVQAVTGGWTPILAALPLMIQLFLGIETATEVGEEVKNAKVVVPWGIALGLLLTVVVYVAVSFTALSVVGPEALGTAKAPLLMVAQATLGRWATPLIVTAAVAALIKSMNAIFLVYARFLYAMGATGVLPAPLGRIHPRFGTPHMATAVAFLASCTGLFLPDSLLFLLLSINVPTMMKYFGSCLAAYNVADKHPEVRAQARLRFSPGLVKALSALGMLAAIVIAALGFGTDWRPYALLAIWLALGLGYYAQTRRQRPAGC
ncbi:APC family permease [Nitrospirillum viridazoti]|uniref:Amino acid permease-associated protein n=1 Tax=Nitrospirillum viridazoti CBAmc TaxID=1441467 RepID=A0A248K003_9PROT|nr:amino acid permease [Nitrospirillum amazonense]ASG24295.1 amino acid permease-associated protein [Nitrospirillum amazonense CBAmc]TWB40694.1 amino acid/polyamine/organocation transporter (APC superfamily) [Nitrospirillum amazonense]